jgi:hypothetical protein
MDTVIDIDIGVHTDQNTELFITYGPVNAKKAGKIEISGQKIKTVGGGDVDIEEIFEQFSLIGDEFGQLFPS